MLFRSYFRHQSFFEGISGINLYLYGLRNCYLVSHMSDPSKAQLVKPKPFTIGLTRTQTLADSTAAATMAAPRTLVDDLVGEILLRLPPYDPACLARASLVCKPWRRLLSHPAFRRRYLEFHGTPLLLGYLHVLKGDEPYYSRFVSTSALCPAGRDFPGWLVLDCRHGRALFAASSPGAERAVDLVVWSPITNEQRRLPNPWTSQPERAAAVHKFNAAVLCAPRKVATTSAACATVARSAAIPFTPGPPPPPASTHRSPDRGARPTLFMSPMFWST